jgi:hypothetical protein
MLESCVSHQLAAEHRPGWCDLMYLLLEIAKLHELMPYLVLTASVQEIRL